MKNKTEIIQELKKALKSKYGDLIFSNSEINKALIALETQGLIHVQNITKNKRRIMTANILKNKNFSFFIMP